MHKPLFILLAVLTALPGCSAFKKSHTWQQVVDNRPDRLASDNGKASYPDKLHAVLAAQNVEHKIVTYQYRYKTRLREDAVGTGKALLYRDGTTPDSPWWAMDETTGFPVWLPNESVDRQVSFFLRHNAEIVAQKDYPAANGKSSEAAPRVVTPLAPIAAAPMLAQKAKADRNGRAKSKPAAVVASNGTDGSSDRSAWLNSLERQFDERFRAAHGTDFDPNSGVDRQKMADLRGMASRKSAEL